LLAHKEVCDEPNNSHLAILGLLSFGIGAPAWAHHSFAAAFDLSSPVTVQGTIVQVGWKIRIHGSSSM
jgi:hypothetical protein